MKKLILVLMSALLLVGCGSGGNNQGSGEKSASNNGDSISVVTTIFPEYDWVKQIVGDSDNVEITMLLDNGVDLHNYQPTAEDIMKIATCDVFVYVGGESDEWVEDALTESVNPDMKVINLLDVLGESAKEEEVVEGMETEEHDHSHEVSTFEDDEVEDRGLDDWEGEWQSPYPFVLDGTLDTAFEKMSEQNGDKTAEEYKDYYEKGYKTDIKSVNIDGDTIEYTYDDGKVVSSAYKYVGFYIQNWSTGTKAAMYRFEAEDKDSGAPLYIEINDHMISSEKSEHFHLRMSDEGFDAIEDPESSWPTFFPADMTGEQINAHLSGDEDQEEEEVEYDEHVWLSLKNAKVLVNALADTLEEVDATNADTYKANAEAYVSQLEDLDGQYDEVVRGATNDTVLFGDRFPFRYLVDDYGLNYYAAFVGCSAETEASFETITFLADKVDELGLNAIFTIENSDKKIAETIIENTDSKDAKILTLDSMQSTTSDDVANGVTYLSIMEKNLEVLAEAIN